MKTLIVILFFALAPALAHAEQNQTTAHLAIPTLDCQDLDWTQSVHAFRLKPLGGKHFTLETDIMSCGILTTTTQGLAHAEAGALFDDSGNATPTINIELLAQRGKITGDQWAYLPIPKTMGWIAYDAAKKEATYYQSQETAGYPSLTGFISKLRCK